MRFMYTTGPDQTGRFQIGRLPAGEYLGVATQPFEQWFEWDPEFQKKVKPGAKRFQLIDGETEILRGIRGIPTPGHVPFHQSILIESGGERACFVADLVPTSAHLPLPWIMGYDLEPLVTLETRRRLYQRAEAEQWLLIFEHDPNVVSGRLAKDGKGVGLVNEKRLD